MGSPFNIIMIGDNALKANQLAHSSFELVDSLNHIFSKIGRAHV